MADKVRVGIVGVGNILSQYVAGIRAFPLLEIAACADLDMARAESRAAEFNIPRALTVDELLADPDIDLILNLTVPLAHAELSLRALAAGKHVYSEKPLAVHREDGLRIMQAAHEQGLLVGCAPDTFMGGGLQTCRKLIDDGAIGVPFAATAFMAGRGPESWHPNPDFFYQVGGGPMLDMGPYYVTALVHLLGGVRRVTGSARISFPERVASSAANNGRRIPVEVPTHVAGILDFESGAVATLITSFDVWAHMLPRIEIYGSEGSLSVPDPNTFNGPVMIRQPQDKDWRGVPLTHSEKVGRGIGIADMAYALRYGRPHRASGELAYHVLDVMHAIQDSSVSEKHIRLEAIPPQPQPLPVGLADGVLDTAQ